MECSGKAMSGGFHMKSATKDQQFARNGKGYVLRHWWFCWQRTSAARRLGNRINCGHTGVFTLRFFVVKIKSSICVCRLSSSHLKDKEKNSEYNTMCWKRKVATDHTDLCMK